MFEPKTIDDERLYLNGEFNLRSIWELIIKEAREDYEKLQEVVKKYDIPRKPGGNVVDAVIREFEQMKAELDGS